MASIEVNGTPIEVNADGFLVNPDDWNENAAGVLAAQANISLTPRHWDVINFCRKDFAATGKSPGVRRITKVGGVPTKEMYALFPGGPGKLAAKLSGLEKPKGCL